MLICRRFEAFLTAAIFLILLQSSGLLTLSAQMPINTRLQERPALQISKAIHDSTPFLEHSGVGTFDNYLAMNLAFAPAEALRKDLEKALEKLFGAGFALKHRGEAHITVISPPEYSAVLGKVLTMKEINDIARTMKIQNAGFTPLCVGRAQVNIEGKPEQTYFVVVESEDLLRIRRAVFEKFVAKGGEPSLWDPLHFYPHITLGFSKQDLHEEGQGVKKGMNACFFGLVEK